MYSPSFTDREQKALDNLPRTHQQMQRGQHVRVFWAGLVRSAHVSREVEPYVWRLYSIFMNPPYACFHASAIESSDFLIWGDTFPDDPNYLGEPSV